METLITENMENAPMLPVVSTETTETLEQLPPSVTNMQAPETSLPEVTNSETTENLDQTALLEVTNTNETAPFDEPTPPPAANIQTTETLDQSTVPLLEITEITVTMEQSVIPLEVTDNSHENVIAFPENHQGVETRLETTEEEEVRSVLKVIAETGKFWYDWEKLRSMLSLHLKQVISEYPQAKMSPEEQKVSLGETHAELVKRLDDALLSFVDGPPFTLQRLSEIILDARSMYPNLSKLALALEKNLSVTSTLTMSTNPYPSSVITTRNELNKVIADPIPSTNSQMQFDTVIENGVPPEAADNDKIMTEVDADVSDVMTMEVETNESPMTTDIVGSSRVLVQPTGLSKLSSSSTFILQQNSNQFAISKISTEGENVACHDQIEFRQQTP